MTDNLADTLVNLETEVLEKLDNPYHTYSVKFPWQVSFSFADDDYNTTLIIESKSEVLRYGRNEHDIELQMELDLEHSQTTYAKHLINWVRDRIDSIDHREVAVTYGDNLTIEVMSAEEIEDFRQDCLSHE